MEINGSGELIVTYTDGTEDNLGKITADTPDPGPDPEEPTLEYLLFDILSDSEVSVKINPNYVNSVDKIVIPNEYNGRTVTTITDNGFKDCQHLQNISLPDSITSIGAVSYTHLDVYKRQTMKAWKMLPILHSSHSDG